MIVQQCTSAVCHGQHRGAEEGHLAISTSTQAYIAFRKAPPLLHSFVCHCAHLPLPLQRADEVSKVDPKVAYYCRMYAIEQVSQPKQDAKAC